MISAAWVLWAIFLLLIFWAIGAYQRLKTLRVKVQIAFTQLAEQARMTHEIMPDLIKMARLFMKNEMETHEDLQYAYDQAIATTTAAKTNLFSATAIADMSEADGRLMQSNKRLFALSEAYPDMKSNGAVVTLRGELARAHHKQAFARQLFNEQAAAYNVAISQFPAMLIAAILKYHPTALIADLSAEELTLSQLSRFDTLSQ